MYGVMVIWIVHGVCSMGIVIAGDGITRQKSICNWFHMDETTQFVPLRKFDDAYYWKEIWISKYIRSFWVKKYISV